MGETAKARSAIRYALRVQRKDDLVGLGRKILQKFCQSTDIDPSIIDTLAMKEIASALNISDEDGIFEAIALGSLAVEELGQK